MHYLNYNISISIDNIFYSIIKKIVRLIVIVYLSFLFKASSQYYAA